MEFDVERDRESERRSDLAGASGFALYGVNLGLAAFISGASLILFFSGRQPNVGAWLGISDFDNRFAAFRTWSRLVACLLLAAAWPNNPGWRRRSALLLLLASVEVVLWGITYAVPMGFAQQESPHQAFCRHLQMALGWSRFLLIASLAADFGRHVGVPRAIEFGKAIGKTAAGGATIWFLSFLLTVDWDHPWPLADRRLTLDLLQLLLATQVVGILCSFQAAVLALRGAYFGLKAVHEMGRDDQAFDPWSASAEPGR